MRTNTPHIYTTTRDSTATMRFVDALTGKEHGAPVVLEHKAGRYVFRGGVKAFRAFLDAQNREHGAGFAHE